MSQLYEQNMDLSYIIIYFFHKKRRLEKKIALTNIAFVQYLFWKFSIKINHFHIKYWNRM